MRVLLGLALLLAGAAASSEPKNIHTLVNARWEPTPLLLEAAEFVGDGGQTSLFWRFLEKVFDMRATAWTDKFQHDTALRLVGEVMAGSDAAVSSSQQLSVLKYSLAIHYYSPKLEAYRQMLTTHITQVYGSNPDSIRSHNGCQALLASPKLGSLQCVLHNGQAADVKGTKAFVQQIGHGSAKNVPYSDSANIFAFDHASEGCPEPASAPSGVVILYANPMAAGVSDVHKALQSTCGGAGVAYVFRPLCGPVAVSPADEDLAFASNYNFTAAKLWNSRHKPLSLMGFGVELAIKNMEYKVIDDTKIQEEDEELLEMDDAMESEVGGMFFKRLYKRRPELQKKLEKFREDLLQDAGTQAQSKVKAWEMKDLGVQATQTIIRSDTPLVLLRDMSQNFPMYGNTLARLTVNKVVKRALASNQKIIDHGTNIMFLNGVPVDPATVDLFDLHSMLRLEAATVDSLSALRLQPASVNKLMQLPASTSTNQESRMEIDYKAKVGQGGVIFWLNNIEDPSERRYQQWPRDLRQLLTPGWPNQLRYVRRNLYTGVLVVDPTSPRSLATFGKALFFVRGNAPIRIGVVFSPQAGGGTAEPLSLASLFDDKEWSDLFAKGVWADKIAALAGATGSGKKALGLGPLIVSLFFHLYHQLNKPSKAIAFLEKLAKEQRLTKSVVKGIFKKFFRSAGGSGSPKKLYREGGDKDAAARAAFVSASRTWVATKGLSAQGDQTLFIVNGIPALADAHSFREVMMQHILTNQQQMQFKVYNGQVKESTDFDTYWNSLPDVVARHSPQITVPEAQFKFVNELPSARPPPFKPVYLAPTNSLVEGSAKGLTLYAVVDLNTEAGVALAAGALKYLERKEQEAKQFEEAVARGEVVPEDSPLRAFSRICFVQNPSDAEGSPATEFVSSLFSSLSARRVVTAKRLNAAVKTLRRAVMLAADQVDQQHTAGLGMERNLAAWTQLAKESETPFPADGARSRIVEERDYVQGAFGLAHGASAIVANGRRLLVGGRSTVVDRSAQPTLRELTALSYDIGLLDRMGADSGLHKIVEVVAGNDFQQLSSDEVTSDLLSDIVANAAFSLAKRTSALQDSGVSSSATGSFNPSMLNTDASIHVKPPHADRPSVLSASLVLDPLSQAAQRICGLLVELQGAFNMDVRIFLNPRNDIGELPLKRFYRFAVASELTFDEKGAVVPSPGAVFRGLRNKNLLTLGIDMPEPWLVQSMVSQHDLDNLRLDELGVQTLAVQYQLEHILLAGPCNDETRRDPPAGLQLWLGMGNVAHVQDTVVMKNLGYFQLKANPGVWRVSIAPSQAHIMSISDAVSSDFRRAITSGQGQQQEDKDSAVVAAAARPADHKDEEKTRLYSVLRFNQPAASLNVVRKPGMERAEIIAKSQGSGVWARVTNLFGGGDANEQGSAGKKPESDDTIHIFSIASGHLYERFLKIMMLSVLNSTKAPVKFWFIKNFLSPQFKEFVPVMANHLGFDVEFVTYKWPSWLRRQTEKQRIIWGHKILFLDTLFPLSLKRVIFVDADQVVRGDVKELQEMKLGSAPYAYTPFCDSNKKTEGFRFWKQGYWQNHLKGKPYHISALYVVDLEKFRRMRAGDSLRMIYDNLSQDPNSLANLDQDLPNYAQHMVPIKSLPQEWLWCQTWCSMDTLKKAKTIDLCNNPLTKRPKLEVARELLPEWTVLDERARELEAKLSPKK